jgi:hypothetical protein
VQRTEQLHLAEWSRENRRLSATDQITKPYESLLPPPPSQRTELARPQISDLAAANASKGIAALLAASEPLSTDPAFLFGDLIEYIGAAKGVDADTASSIRGRLNAFQHAYAGRDIQAAARYFDAEIHRAALPATVNGAYRGLLTMTKTSSATAAKVNASQIELSLSGMEQRLSDLESVYRSLPEAEPSVLNALDEQQRSIEKMVTCFQTFVHEWTTYGGGPGSLSDDPAAHLPLDIRAAFCEPEGGPRA